MTPRLQQAWSDRREPPALRAALRRAAASIATAASTDDLLQAAQERKGEEQTPSPLTPPSLLAGNEDDASGNAHSHNESSACDVRLLFVSGSGLARSGGGNSNGGAQRAGGAQPADMWRVLGRELWNPWPQADVVVHTGSQASAVHHGMLEHAVEGLNAAAIALRIRTYYTGGVVREKYDR